MVTTLRTALLAGMLLAVVGCDSAPAPQLSTARVTRSAPVSSTPAASATPRTSRPAAVPTVANPGRLSDEQLVGQLFIGYVYGAAGDTADPGQRAANLALYGVATPAEVVRRWHLGGVILLDHNTLDPARAQLSTGNVDSAGQITGLTAGLQRAAVADTGRPLLIGTDQEGGDVQRITDGVSARASQESLADTDPAALRCGYQQLGGQLRRLGVNQDYAPVADVIRTTGGVIGDRSFGSDPALDSRDVSAAVTGLQAAGVLATLKHWPGHGSTATDSHAALAVITESAAQWSAVDRPPFAAAAGTAAAIMVGHLALPALDPSGSPATLSPVLVGGQLRQGLHYRGLVLTDSLWMQPVRQAGTPGQVAQRAIAAGNDMLLMSPDLPAAYRDVLARFRADQGFRAQVRAAGTRILAAKATVASRPRPDPGC